MRSNMNYIKLVGLLIIIGGLYAFSSHRSERKKVAGMTVEFVGDQNLYITQEAVNKLLIQKFGGLENVPKEKLALNTMEKVIEANEMVKNAQVYVTVDGKLESKIVQRRPIGRVESVTKFYIDDDGKRMPLSSSHSARVPIITGKITGESLEEDEFLRKNVIGIHISDLEKYQLKFRVENFVVNLGGIDNLEEKFNNFKAFYAKANKDETLEKYAVVSLEFNNQVVCTKI